MSNLIKFLEKIHVPKDILDKIQGEEDVDIEEVSKSYLDSRDSFYESTKLKTKIDPEINKTVSGMALKAIKKINEIAGMGLTNTQMEELVKKENPIESFTADAKKHLEAEMNKLKSATNEDLLKDLEKFKGLATDRQKELDELSGKWKDFEVKKEQEVQDKINSFEAKQFWNKLIREDTDIPDVPGRSFALESIEERIFNSYKVDKDGNIYNKDGTTATHPEKEINIHKLEEIYPYFKEKAGLVKVSNAGVGADGKPLVVNPKMGANEKAMHDQILAARKVGVN
jgi:hypothetical protein